jgi:hypothetical protein
MPEKCLKSLRATKSKLVQGGWCPHLPVASFAGQGWTPRPTVVATVGARVGGLEAEQAAEQASAGSKVGQASHTQRNRPANVAGGRSDCFAVT